MGEHGHLRFIHGVSEIDVKTRITNYMCIHSYKTTKCNYWVHSVESTAIIPNRRLIYGMEYLHSSYSETCL